MRARGRPRRRATRSHVIKKIAHQDSCSSCSPTSASAAPPTARRARAPRTQHRTGVMLVVCAGVALGTAHNVRIPDNIDIVSASRTIRSRPVHACAALERSGGDSLRIPACAAVRTTEIIFARSRGPSSVREQSSTSTRARVHGRTNTRTSSVRGGRTSTRTSTRARRAGRGRRSPPSKDTLPSTRLSQHHHDNEHERSGELGLATTRLPPPPVPTAARTS